MRSLAISTQLLRRFAAFPVPLALQSCDDFSGRGVTLAVLDSAFVLHPDLSQPDNRIVAYYDASDEDFPLDAPASGRHWHGSMTSVVAAGNGFLSDGLYRGLAPEVGVVLIKTSGSDGIDESFIVRGLQWLLDNRERYKVRVLTTSLQANDQEISAWDDQADVLLEALVQAGVTVVCSAGNDFRVSTPPGNSPSVITVGGVSLEGRTLVPYDPSCHGETVDGFMKPEIVALASQVAAPILLDTPDSQTAGALTRLAHSDDGVVQELTRELWEQAGLPEEACGWEAGQIVATVAALIRQQGILSPFYKSVDGTSFSAPIVASVVAQMLEANPALHPRQIKQILVQTADLIEGVDKERQGFGLVNPRRAVERALAEPRQRPQTLWFSPPRQEGAEVVFRHFRPQAQSVSLGGDFNGWEPQPFRRDAQGLWTLRLAVPPGQYAYKLVIDGEWQEDPSNLRLTPDGAGGQNSLLNVS